ncbi:nrg1-like zn-finger transcription factor [Moniliophthora roreri MCA 2997]|uniref:Nrg1-like zn-finger transcription factor n=1 Tax=Moniliophthora roreri (strain MCA 2997) TaxID=1381753 RepID=V2WKB0_MONRO|nr:nrg1-like zn-finger transcription factor [Moniliophthora roreri MCA 2997]
MPRAESKNMGSQFYQDQPNSSSTFPAAQGQAGPPSHKKKHVCSTCDRAFTTSGHLARHSRVHTGEKNHKCPFPGCETRCSRQDNLQQHYRIHLSPGSRRTSSKSAGARAPRVVGAKRGSSSVLVPSSTTANIPPPPDSPPPLEQARVYIHSPPPDSPPPLAQATLPATIVHSQSHSSQPASRTSASPTLESPYNHAYDSPNIPPPLSTSMPSHSPHPHPHSQSPTSYSYRNSTSTYQEQMPANGYTYVHTTPVSQSHQVHSSPEASYSGSNNYPTHQTLPNISTIPYYSKDNSPTGSPISASMPSRHSISHISHADSSYPSPDNSQPPALSGPPSPASGSSHSISSHTSGPSTPAYIYQEDGAAHGQYDNGGIMAGDHSHTMMSHASYSPALSVHSETSANLGPSLSRYASPPPILAPIQGYQHGESHGRMPRIVSSDVRIIDDRYGARFLEDRHPSPHGIQHQAHYPQPQHMSPVSSGYGYADGMNISHGGWKSEAGLRSRGIGALVQ